MCVRKLICAVLSVLLLLGAVVMAWAEDTATLTITPDKTEVTADGNDIQVVFTVTVAPPQGKELGVFSFRLKPSGTMTLPKSFKVDGERVITYESLDLEYDINTDKGVFRTYEYTPGSCFFAAVGSSEGRRMTESAAILTITATIPAGSTGTFTLDAEFVAAPDGSGTTYTPRVDSTPVTVKGTGGSGGPGGSGGSNSAEKPETGEPTSGETPDVTDKPDVPQGSLPAAADDPQVVISPAPGAAAAAVLDTAQKGGTGTSLAAVALGVLAAAGAVCQMAIPGGLAKLCSKKQYRKTERTKEEST